MSIYKLNPFTGTLDIVSDLSNTVITSWQSYSGTALSLEAGNAYETTSSSSVTATLPASSSDAGTLIEIEVNGTGAVTIAQGTGQQIRFGNQTTTSGVGGSLTSTNRGDVITLRCTTTASASTGFWLVTNSVGNWSVV